MQIKFLCKIKIARVNVDVIQLVNFDISIKATITLERCAEGNYGVKEVRDIRCKCSTNSDYRKL